MSGYGFDTLDLSIPVLLWCSGGRDSTAMALLLYDYLKENKEVADVTIITTHTHYNKKDNLKVIDRLVELTDFKRENIHYEGDIRAGKIMNISFKTIPRALRGIEYQGERSAKKFFLCCKVLKHKPAKKYLKSIPKGEVINMLGFARADRGTHRGYRLTQIRKKCTFYRSLSEFYNHFYFYPLRDVEKDEIDSILTDHGFGNISSSGCHICPLFAISKNLQKKDVITAKKTKRVMEKLGIDARPDNQLSLGCFGIEGGTVDELD